MPENNAAPASPAPASERPPGGALVPVTDLYRPPIFDSIDARKLALIKAQIAPGCTDGEVGHFLELCAHYELDAFAREAWCAKSKTGKLLIMVGRDGLRKIGQRNGLHIDGDVVRAKDEFTICRTPDGNRTVAHSYGNPAQRGEIIGAWAECRMGGPMGKPMGYFYAPLEEYLPKGASDYSPWSKQVGVMILAAAERQAIRQATPLGGLLAVGEDELVDENTRPALGDGQGDGQPAGLDLGPEVERVIRRAADLGHAALSDRATIEMVLGDQPPAKVQEWVKAAAVELDAIPVDAEVVEAHSADLSRSVAQEGDRASRAPDGPQPPPQPREAVKSPDGAPAEGRSAAKAPNSDQPPPDPERIEALRRRAQQLLSDADAHEARGDMGAAADAQDEAEALMAQVEAAGNPAQGALAL